MSQCQQKRSCPEALKGKKVTILGYGSQGRAHALNLRDSGADVTVALRRGGPTWMQAEQDGFKPQEPAQAVKGADVVCFLTPDMVQPALYKEHVEPNLKQGATLMFAHGFNVHYKQLQPPAHADVALVAPKGPGALVRRQFEQGCAVPCLVAVHQDATGKAKDTAFAYAAGLGATRDVCLETTFAEETETDLFGEQAVLCGGVTELIAAGWETLVEAGYQPEVAYFECLHEVKLIVDLIYEGGFAKMHQYVSDTAKYGDLTRGPRVVDEGTRKRMREILKEIQDGTFANEWVAEYKAGSKRYKELLDKDLNHEVEKVGKQLRAKMPWLEAVRTQQVQRELAAAGSKG